MQRGIQLRTSYTGKPNVSALALSRASNADAAFHHLFGNDPEKPCGSCQKGLGPFEGCYVVEGACGNCRWNSANSRCEFHPDSKCLLPYAPIHTLTLPYRHQRQAEDPGQGR